MTPANRAPKFVVMDRNHIVSDVTETEDEARACAIRADTHWPDATPSTIHPIGPALPAAVKAKSPARMACEAAGQSWADQGPGGQEYWASVAQAVIAAHEAGKPAAKTETVTRYACVHAIGGWAFRADGTCSDDKSKRLLFGDRKTAVSFANQYACMVVPVVTIRRVRGGK